MSRRLYAGAGAAVAAVGVAALVVVLTTSPEARTPSPAGGIAASATIAPPTAFFGDTLFARVDVLVDPHRIDPASVSVDSRFAPYESGKPLASRRDDGGMVRLDYTFLLRCFVSSCVPPDPARGGRRTFDLGPVTVAYRAGGARKTLLLTLDSVDVSSRMTINDAARLGAVPPPPWRASLAVGRLEYSVSPTLLVVLLLAAAALLLAGAAVLVVRFARRPRVAPPPPPPPAPPVVLSPLERALLALERARAAGLVPEERKALELLARELGRNGDSHLAVTAKGLAWSEDGPVPAATLVLTEDVRTLIEQGGDGHPQ